MGTWNLKKKKAHYENVTVIITLAGMDLMSMQEALSPPSIRKAV